MMMSLSHQPIVVGHSVQLLASQNAIMQRFTKIGECQAGCSQQYQQPQDSSYLEFLATQPLVFAEMMDPLEANHWLRVIESKFGLFHCSEL
jgi:hypothetical protein